MLGDREVTSEQLMFIRKGVGYDEVFPSGHGLKDGFSWSIERELSAHSLDD